MSRYLALDLEQNHLYLTASSFKAGVVKIEKALALTDFGTVTAQNATELGRRLKEALASAEIAPAPVLISIGRERVILKDVKYPAGIAPAEEPAVVRFQVAKDLAEGADNVVVDYFALPTPEPDGQRRALAFAIRKDVIAPLRALCQAAGLKLASITPRSFGIAASLVRALKDGAVTPPESSQAPMGLLVRGDKWGELVILRGGQVAFSRSMTGAALNSETAMLGEIRRNLAVFSGPSAQNQVSALYVAEGDLPGGWAGRVRAGLNVPVQAFDPIAGTTTSVPPEVHGCFAGPVGLMALWARSPELPINFLLPRQPKPTSDPAKRLIGLVAVAACLLLVGGLIIGRFVVSNKSSAVSALQTQKTDLEDDLKKLDEVSKRVKAVRDWEDKGINWLDELYDLTARFPDPSTTEVVQLTGSALEQGSKSTAKYSAEMALTMQTQAARNVDSLIIHMSQDRHYAIGGKQSKGSVGSSGGNRKNEQFLLKVQIEHREPSKYDLKLTATPPPILDRKKDERNRASLSGGFGDFGGRP